MHHPLFDLLDHTSEGEWHIEGTLGTHISGWRLDIHQGVFRGLRRLCFRVQAAPSLDWQVLVSVTFVQYNAHQTDPWSFKQAWRWLKRHTNFALVHQRLAQFHDQIITLYPTVLWKLVLGSGRVSVCSVEEKPRSLSVPETAKTLLDPLHSLLLPKNDLCCSYGRMTFLGPLSLHDRMALIARG